MTGTEAKSMDARDLKLQPGDVVAIRAPVKQVVEGVGLKVELWSKTGQHEVWVREDLVVDRLVEAEDADEPPVGSYVEVHSSVPGRGVTVWRRDEADGWVIANREEVGGYPWREIKANSAARRLLYDGNEDR